MPVIFKRFGWMAGGLAAVALSACAPSFNLPFSNVAKGAQLPIIDVLQANSGQYACTLYDASSDTCQSVFTFAVGSGGVTSREYGAIRSGGGTVPIEVVSQAWIEGNQTCVRAENVSVSGPSPTVAKVETRLKGLINSYGGVCTTLYEGTDGFVMETRGRNGEIFPPGNVPVRFFPVQKSVRSG